MMGDATSTQRRFTPRALVSSADQRLDTLPEMQQGRVAAGSGLVIAAALSVLMLFRAVAPETRGASSVGSPAGAARLPWSLNPRDSLLRIRSMQPRSCACRRLFTFDLGTNAPPPGASTTHVDIGGSGKLGRSRNCPRTPASGQSRSIPERCLRLPPLPWLVGHRGYWWLTARHGG